MGRPMLIKMKNFLCVFIPFLIFAFKVRSDEIDIEVHSGAVFKMLREVVNKANASDSLNLPANASSIRENITDTFSCENRSYGYYADVDNECQVFHVCLPSQTPSGRNVTYKWSFICPAETVFNQEVLVCTRPIDSIPCEESEEYYYVNMEIGKVPPKNETESDQIEGTKKYESHIDKGTKNKNYVERVTKKNEINPNPKRRPDHRKQNIVIEELFKEVVDKEMAEKLQNVDFEDVGEILPDIITDENRAEELREDLEERIALERSMGNRFRFKADV